MGLDIYSKSGLHFRSGYGMFTFMRQDCCNQILKGSAAIHEWASNLSFLRGIEIYEGLKEIFDTAYVGGIMIHQGEQK